MFYSLLISTFLPLALAGGPPTEKIPPKAETVIELIREDLQPKIEQLESELNKLKYLEIEKSSTPFALGHLRYAEKLRGADDRVYYSETVRAFANQTTNSLFQLPWDDLSAAKEIRDQLNSPTFQKILRDWREVKNKIETELLNPKANLSELQKSKEKLEQLEGKLAKVQNKVFNDLANKHGGKFTKKQLVNLRLWYDSFWDEFVKFASSREEFNLHVARIVARLHERGVETGLFPKPSNLLRSSDEWEQRQAEKEASEKAAQEAIEKKKTEIKKARINLAKAIKYLRTNYGKYFSKIKLRLR